LLSSDYSSDFDAAHPVPDFRSPINHQRGVAHSNFGRLYLAGTRFHSSTNNQYRKYSAWEFHRAIAPICVIRIGSSASIDTSPSFAIIASSFSSPALAAVNSLSPVKMLFAHIKPLPTPAPYQQ
jgi:hypothetical protein